MSVTTAYQNYGIRFSRNHEDGGTWAQWWADTTCSYFGQDYTPKGSTYHGDNSNSYDIYRSTMYYDTSGVPANATISSAVWNGYIKKVGDSTEATNIIYLCPVSATGLSAGYYNKAYFGTALASDAKDDVNTDNYNQWWSPSIATTAITKAGTTILGLRHYHDYVNSPPWGNNVTSIYEFAPYNDATYKSYLTITWTTPPVVTTGAVTDLQPISATLAGNVTDVGGGTISSRGVCWSTSANPTTSNSKATSAGTTGEYTVNATGLLPGTLYHYRAYVITENSTQYGADTTFRTPGGAIMFNLL